MALICTDGELYGHHQPFRDLFLDRLLTVGADHASIDAMTPGEWLARIDPLALPVGTIVEHTSWSCHHGIGRWMGPCGCTSDGSWKAALRQAFDRTASAIDTATEAHLGALGIDAWAARDRYADVASGYIEPRAWVVPSSRAARVARGRTWRRRSRHSWPRRRPGWRCSRVAAGTGMTRGG